MWKLFVRGIRESFGRCGERAVGSACEGNNFTTNARPGGKERDCNNDSSAHTNSTSGLASEALCSHNFFKGVGLGTVVWLTQFARDWHHWKRHTPAESYFSHDSSVDKQKCRYKCLLQILAGVAKTQPRGPQAIAEESSSSVESIISSEESVGSILSSVTREEQLGIVPNKELEEARNGFGEINSNIENLLGVYYYDHYEPERAVKNFQKAWRRGNVKACYNLGLCHELGVGTQPDPVKAAEYYKKAASLGHVQASYNLGVYYAQGRGGLPKDASRAHQLFEHAASQGSLQAKAAISSINEPEMAAHNPSSASWLPVVVGT